MTRSPTKNLPFIALLLATLPCAVHAQSNTEERAVGAFSRLAVQDGIDVRLTQAAETRLRIEVEGYELDDIVAEVVADELRLSNSARRGFSFFNAGGDVTVYLDVAELTAIRASAGSDISGANEFQVDALSVQASGGSDIDLDVQAQSLEFKLSGGSDLRVRGAARSVTIAASGGSDVSAGSLEAEEVTVRASGGSDASVRASAAVVIEASGGSDVAVQGDPAQRTVNNDRSSDVAWR
jgi:hypothetical protein